MRHSPVSPTIAFSLFAVFSASSAFAQLGGVDFAFRHSGQVEFALDHMDRDFHQTLNRLASQQSEVWRDGVPRCAPFTYMDMEDGSVHLSTGAEPCIPRLYYHNPLAGLNVRNEPWAYFDADFRASVSNAVLDAPGTWLDPASGASIQMSNRSDGWTEVRLHAPAFFQRIWLAADFDAELKLVAQVIDWDAESEFDAEVQVMGLTMTLEVQLAARDGQVEVAAARNFDVELDWVEVTEFRLESSGNVLRFLPDVNCTGSCTAIMQDRLDGLQSYLGDKVDFVNGAIGSSMRPPVVNRFEYKGSKLRIRPLIQAVFDDMVEEHLAGPVEAAVQGVLASGLELDVEARSGTHEVRSAVALDGVRALRSTVFGHEPLLVAEVDTTVRGRVIPDACARDLIAPAGVAPSVAPAYPSADLHLALPIPMLEGIAFVAGQGGLYCRSGLPVSLSVGGSPLSMLASIRPEGEIEVILSSFREFEGLASGRELDGMSFRSDRTSYQSTELRSGFTGRGFRFVVPVVLEGEGRRTRVGGLGAGIYDYAIEGHAELSVLVVMRVGCDNRMVLDVVQTSLSSIEGEVGLDFLGVGAPAPVHSALELNLTTAQEDAIRAQLRSHIAPTYDVTRRLTTGAARWYEYTGVPTFPVSIDLGLKLGALADAGVALTPVRYAAASNHPDWAIVSFDLTPNERSVEPHPVCARETLRSGDFR